MRQQATGTGRRKRAVAQIRVVPGVGRFLINRREVRDYFPVESLQQKVFLPLSLAQGIREVDVLARVSGGGVSGQAGAVLLGLSRALLHFDPTLRPIFRQHGLLTRDPREKERKKYGLHRARRAQQYSKR